MSSKARTLCTLALCLLASASGATGPAGTGIGVMVGAPMAGMVAAAQRVDWTPTVEYSEILLTVVGPADFQFQKSFASGQKPTFEIANDQADGTYTYELRVTPPGPRRIRGSAAQATAESAATTQRPLVQSGFFTIRNGSMVVPNMPEPSQPPPPSTTAPSATAQGTGSVTPLDVVHNDDVIVTGGLCVGVDCLTDGTENFNFRTILLKENNDRLYFDDTSVSAGFPANDWQILINDTTSGGGNYFAVNDVTAGRSPFTIEAGARTNALYVASSGKVGIGTATPVLNLHVLSGDTPALRLQQDGSVGYSPQTWDVAGNEANFFVRDVTNGSHLPFRILPGAPTYSLVVAGSGNVGIGTTSPYYTLDVPSGFMRVGGGVYVGANAGLYTLDFLGNTGADRNVFRAGISGYSNGFTVRYRNSPAAMLYSFINGYVGVGTTSPTHMLQVGTAYCDGGVWVAGSSREYKQDIEELSTEAAEDAVAKLNPVTYEYKVSPGEHHVGFIAEDVPDLVATKDRKGLSSMDVVAVLTKVVQQQQKAIADLQAQVGELRRQK
jgi:hypothetical protein